MPQKQVCIVGAGPASLAALKVFLGSPPVQDGKWQVTVYEEREAVAGLWVPSSPDQHPPYSPIYDSLTSNLPHPVMSYACFPFPNNTHLYPKASIVLDYFNDFCDHFKLRPHIQLNRRVTSVSKAGDQFTVSTVSTLDPAKTETRTFDFVVVANGHYRTPRLPDAPGINDWVSKGKAMHAAYYRHPKSEWGKKLLVIGAGPSGRDVSIDFRKYPSYETVVQSVPGSPPISSTDRFKVYPRVVGFGDVSKGEVMFEGDVKEDGFDFVIVATGYEFAFPFLKDDILKHGSPPGYQPIPENGVWNSGHHIFPLARHIFPLSLPNIAFIGLPNMVVPLPLFEAQAEAIARVFADPSVFVRSKEEEGITREFTAKKAKWEDKVDEKWLSIGAGDTQYDYRDRLYKLALGGTDRQVDSFVALAFEDMIDATPADRTRETPLEFNGFVPERFIPEKMGVPAWQKWARMNNEPLRKSWVSLETKDEWVKDVGKGGDAEWVALIERLLNRQASLAQ